jgi:hypothetical protein
VKVAPEARDVLAIAGLVLAGALLTRCGGDAFTAAAADAGGDLAPLEGAAVVGLEAGEDLDGAAVAEQLEALEGAADVREDLDAPAAADVGDHQADAGERLDGAGEADAPALCCSLTCGSGLYLPGAGWTCPAPGCVLGGLCVHGTSCGKVVACP